MFTRVEASFGPISHEVGLVNCQEAISSFTIITDFGLHTFMQTSLKISKKKKNKKKKEGESMES